jgi:hypothetical protein
VTRNLLPRRSISIAQLASHVLAGFRQEGQNGLITLLALVFGIVGSAPAHLLAIESVHRGVGVHSNRVQLHIRCFPHSLTQHPLHDQQLLAYLQMQGRQKSPERGLRRQLPDLQDSGQHRVLRYKTQMIQSRETHVEG